MGWIYLAGFLICWVVAAYLGSRDGSPLEQEVGVGALVAMIWPLAAVGAVVYLIVRYIEKRVGR